MKIPKLNKLTKLILATLYICTLLGFLFLPNPQPVSAAGALTVDSAQIFQNVKEEGDWLICVVYENEWNPPFPAGLALAYFELTLYDGANDVAKIPLPAWRYKPAWIYLSPAEAAGLTWGDVAYEIHMQGKASQYAAPVPSDDYAIQAADWKGTTENKQLIYQWIRDTAVLMEADYGLDYYTEEYGGRTFPVGEGILTVLGAADFIRGCPDIDLLCPDVFYEVSGESAYTEKVWTDAYGGTLDYTTALGADIGTLADDTGTMVNFSGKGILATITFVIYVIALGIVISRIPEPSVALGGCLPIPFFGLWIGVVPLAVAGVAAGIITLMFVMSLWIRAS